MGVTQYIGARYVPLFAKPIEWNNQRTYEPLTIVYHKGNSYTSRQSVPIGIDISNNDYWALTGNYNAQIEQYRVEVTALSNTVKKFESSITEVENSVKTEKVERTEADASLENKIAAQTPVIKNQLSSIPSTETFVEYDEGNKIVYSPAYGSNMLSASYNPLPLMYVLDGYIKASEIKYGNDYTATNVNADFTNWEPAMNHPDSDGKFNIDCTTLCILAMLGVYYSDSSYKKPYNTPNNMAINMFSETVKQYIGYESQQIGDDEIVPQHRRLLASELAKMLYDSGRLTPMYNNIGIAAQLQVGDIAFLANTEEAGHWNKIGHCVIIVDKIGSNVICVDSSKNRGGVNNTVNYHALSTLELSQIKYKIPCPVYNVPYNITYNNVTAVTDMGTTAKKQTMIKAGYFVIKNTTAQKINVTVKKTYPEPVGLQTQTVILNGNEAFCGFAPSSCVMECTADKEGCKIKYCITPRIPNFEIV